MPHLQDNFTRNRNVRWIYIGAFVVSLLAAFTNFQNSQYFESFSIFGSDIVEAESKIQSFQYIEILMTLFRITGFILFLVWLYRSYKNAVEFDTTYTTTTPGWAAGGFFVPFYNLYAGYKAIKETWLVHEEKAQDKPGETSTHASSLTLPIVWWSVFLITSFLSNIGGRIFDENDYITSTPYTFHLVEHLFYCVYLGVSIVLLKKMDQMETDAYAYHHQSDLMDHLTSE